MWQFWVQIVLLALLASYLLIRQFQRMRLPVGEREWAGKGGDLSTLQSRIHRLREDYVSSPRARLRRSSCREKLAASVRQTIQRPSCLRSGKTDDSGDVTREMHESLTGRA